MRTFAAIVVTTKTAAITAGATVAVVGMAIGGTAGSKQGPGSIVR